MSPRRPELACDVVELLGGPRDAPVVVAVSGGSDSVALLWLMHDAHRAGRIPPLHVAHLNHHIRPGDAEADAAFVHSLAARLALPVTCGDADVPAHARAGGGSIEQAARECRYAFLGETARAVGARCIALGHTVDDQVETVLFNVLRGAGIHGLAGMPRSRPLTPGSGLRIVRPVIDLGREDLRRFLSDLGETWRTDHTNRDLTHTRNRIRHGLVPLLETSWPSLRSDIAGFTRVLAELDELLQTRAGTWIDANAVPDARGVTARLDCLAALEEPVLSSVVRGLIARTLGDLRRIDEVHVRIIIDLVGEGTTGASLELPRGLVVRRRHDALRFERRTQTPDRTEPGPHAADRETEVPDFAEVELPVPGAARWGGWRFETTILEDRAIREELKRLGGPEPECPPEDPARRMRLFIDRLREVDPGDVEYLDADRAGPEALAVRRRRPGDRLTPLGSPGRRKLKDYLISRHVPRCERDFIPIVAAGDRLLVVVGLGVDDGAALSDNTRRILKITTIRATA